MDDAGFTLIEVMVAALLLVIAMTALAVVLTTSQNESVASVRESQLANIADQQIEQVRAAVSTQGFSALAMSGAPTDSSTTDAELSTYENPDGFIAPAGCGTGDPGLEIENNYDDIAASSTPYQFTQWANCAANEEPLEILSGAQSPAALVQQTASGSPATACTTGTTIASPCTDYLSSTAGSTCAAASSTCFLVYVYTYVTDTGICASSGSSTSACPPVNSSGAITCGGTSAPFPSSTASSTTCGDARRVVIAVVPAQSQNTASFKPKAGVGTPVYISTIFANPSPSFTGAGSVGITLSGTGAL